MNYKMIYLARRNPEIAVEDWPRTWRSHAIFCSQFPVIGANIDSLFYCARVREISSGEGPLELPGANHDYDGVGVVSSDTPEALASSISPNRAAIDADELRVFSTYVNRFTFNCLEELVHGGAAGGVAVFRFLTPKSGCRREDFSARLREDYAELAVRGVKASGTVTRYVHNQLADDPPPGYPFYAITETWFATKEDAARSYTDAAMAPAAACLANFSDPQHSVTLMTEVIHRWPRA
jgi:hypothetical protein